MINTLSFFGAVWRCVHADRDRSIPRLIKKTVDCMAVFILYKAAVKLVQYPMTSIVSIIHIIIHKPFYIGSIVGRCQCERTILIPWYSLIMTTCCNIISHKTRTSCLSPSWTFYFSCLKRYSCSASVCTVSGLQCVTWPLAVSARLLDSRL